VGTGYSAAHLVIRLRRLSLFACWFFAASAFGAVEGLVDTSTGASVDAATQAELDVHNHSGTYELADATILKQADVDDTPSNGVTTAPPSSNWAFDHAALSQAHGISAFGASLMDDVDQAAARTTMGAATTAQGALADSAVQVADINSLSELNAIISDAALIDTGDSRLIDTSWKNSVRAASTVSVNLSAPGTTIDGVVLAQDDRVLIKDQGNPKEHGIYVFNGAASAMTRAPDADTGSELNRAVVMVQEGTANSDLVEKQTTAPVTLGSSNVLWESFWPSFVYATETYGGKIEIATQAETDAETDDLRAITPLKLGVWASTAVTNAATICTGTDNYLDGEGGCDILSTFPGFTDLNTDYSADVDLATLALPASTTISAFGATLTDDADQASARTTMGVDVAGTDNSTNVTLDGTPDYITLSGQVVTRTQIDLTADVTGNLPDGNIASAAAWSAKQAQDAFLDDIAALTDPGADRILFWDDATPNELAWLTLGSGLTITGTTIASSGSAPDIGQYDIAARTAAGTGAYSGFAAGDLTEETAPVAGDFLLGWESGGALRKFDAGDLPDRLIFAASDETTAITTGTEKFCMILEDAFTLTKVHAGVTNAPTGSGITIDINEDGTTVLSTKLTIDATEDDSDDAGTAPVISDSALANGAEICVDFDAVGATLGGDGVKITLVGGWR